MSAKTRTAIYQVKGSIEHQGKSYQPGTEKNPTLIELPMAKAQKHGTHLEYFAADREEAQAQLNPQEPAEQAQDPWNEQEVTETEE